MKYEKKEENYLLLIISFKKIGYFLFLIVNLNSAYLINIINFNI